MIQKKENTKKEGQMSFLYFQEDKHYIGVCLEFNIVEEGATLGEVKKDLETACRLHLKTVQEKKLSDDLLNRHAPAEYWKMYESVEQKQKRSEITSHKTRRLLSRSLSPYSSLFRPSFVFC